MTDTVRIEATPRLALRWADTIDKLCGYPGEPSSEDLAELYKIREQILDHPAVRRTSHVF